MENTEKREKTDKKKRYAVEMILPTATGVPAQVRKGFLSAREADIWLEQIRQRVADNYSCSKQTLESKGFKFRVYKQT